MWDYFGDARMSDGPQIKPVWDLAAHSMPDYDLCQLSSY
jgi:hypothetical protein